MKKVRAAIVGYGNIGHYVLEALQAAPDFEILAGAFSNISYASLPTAMILRPFDAIMFFSI